MAVFITTVLMVLVAIATIADWQIPEQQGTISEF
jgi:hypothetical protein